MYKFYIVPDATVCSSHSELYTRMELFYDPYAESDAYAVIDPKDKDELNKSGSLEFTVLPANIHYADFHKKKTMVIVFDEGTWLYEGIVTDAPVDFYKQRKVTCASPLTFLCDSVQAPDEKNEVQIPSSASGTTYAAVPDTWLAGANPKSLNWRVQSQKADGTIEYVKTNDTSPVSGTRYFYPISSDGGNYSGATTTKAAGTKETIIAHIGRLLDVHNSQVDPFKRIYAGQMYNTSDSETHEFKSSGFRNTWDALKSDILDEYGKYFTITRGNDNNLYLNYLELAQLPSSTVPLIEFANNMMEMNESDDQDDDIFTVLVPIGKDNLTVKDVSGHDSPEHANREVSPYIASWAGNKRYVVVGPKAVERYGYIIKPQTFSDVDNKDTLWTRAVQYIHNNYDYHQEYEVKAIDLRFINGSGHRICVGDKCRIHSKWHGVDTSELYVISAEHDLANPENDTYRLGIPTSDREANNRTLTGQSNSAKSKNAANQASTASGMSRLSSILEDYIHVTEWGLEMNSRLKNEVESNDGKYMTRFLQDEEHINLAAQKLFGVDEDGRGDRDAGYVAVPKSEYKDNKGAYKNPHTEHWFEKNGNTYKLSDDLEANPDKQYYTQRLWTRYSQVDVGPGGIKATVDGNYERSTYCSSWIQANEDAILAITGHIHVDENGQVIIDGGAGVRTGHTSDRVDVHYQAVPKSMYSKSPVSQKWYERVMNSAGTWTGSGVSESEIMQGATPATLGPNESKYYKRSTDSTANPDKYYYIRQSVSEEFTAEYGVYDENNLTGGVVARMVNNPQYFPVDDGTIKEAADLGKTAYELGWYLYNSSTGEFGLGLAGDVVNEHTKYYTKKNNSQVWTDLRGDHIVIGPAVTPAGDGKTDIEKKNETMQDRVNRYLANNKHLNGTICEIASDVVTVHALFAEYINFENAEGIEIWSQFGEFWSLTANHLSVTQDYGDGDVDAGIAYIDWTVTDILQIGETYFDEEEINNQVGNIVMGFGTPTVDGDDVTIPYYVASDNGEYSDDDEDHQITFTKPATIGKAVWSSGSGTHDLKIYTVGGWNGGKDPQWTFYHAIITYPTNYVDGDLDSEENPRISYGRKGSDVGAGGNSPLKDKPTIKAHVELSGEDWDRYGLNVALFHDDAADDTPVIPGWSKFIYVDAKPAYDDGWDQARLQMDWPTAMQALGERTTMTIKFPSETVDEQDETTLTLLDADTKGTSGYVRVYRDYTDDNNRGAMIGAIQVGDWYSDGWADCVDTITAETSYGGDDYIDGEELTLGYSDSATVKAGYFDSGGTWHDTSGVKVKSPSKGSYRTYAKNGDTEYTSGEIDLGTSGGSVTVYGQRKMDGDSDYESADGITIKASASSISDLEIDENGTKVTSINVSLNGSARTLKPWVKVNGSWQSGTECVVYAPSKSSCTMKYTGTETEGEGDSAVTYYCFRTTTNITSDKTMYY